MPIFFAHTETNGTFCGNKIVEEGEECDCGYDEHECKERCCYPRILTEAMKRENASAVQCARRAHTQCRLVLNITSQLIMPYSQKLLWYWVISLVTW